MNPTWADAGLHPDGRLKVLLIEDNPLDARLIQIMLSEAGSEHFEVEKADRLAAGLARLQAGDIGMVLLDLSLPDSHGLATFHRLHTEAPKMPIIVMSGLDDQNVAVTAVHEGAQDYLVKGQVNGPLLVRAMRYAMERIRTAEQLARYAEELRERNAQMEADFNMAREIQQVFLPQSYPAFPPSASPEQSALRFSHRYLSAAAVGGDFFNVFPITDTMAGMFICDVMGHGMRAALVTAIMRGLVEELTPVALDPGKFLMEINRGLHTILKRTEEPLLATAVYVIADVRRGELRFSNAGHPSPIRIQRQTKLVGPLSAYDPRHGPALGLFAESVYPTCYAPLAANDLILLYTDGIYEVYNDNEEEFGQKRLLEAVERSASLDIDDIFSTVLSEVKTFASGSEFEDDVCLLGMHTNWLGASSSS